MIIASQRTHYASLLQLAMVTGKEYIPIDNTTLNEKFGIAPGVRGGTFPTLKYYTVGVGGNDVIVGNGGYSYNSHRPTDAALFNHVPFVLVPINQDISEAEQIKYRFKIKELINGEQYYGYYLKLIPNINFKNSIYKVFVNGKGDNLLSIFNTNTDKLLNPEPENRIVGISNYNTSEYTAVNLKLEFSLFNEEMYNLQSAINLKYGSNRRLTEIGICHGTDKTVNNVLTAVDVQIGYHVRVDFDMAMYINNNENILRSIEIGSMEQLKM